MLSERKVLLEELFSLVDYGQEGEIALSDLLDSLDTVDLEFNQEQIDWLVFECFKKNKNVERLSYTELISSFNEKPIEESVLSEIKEEVSKRSEKPEPLDESEELKREPSPKSQKLPSASDNATPKDVSDDEPEKPSPKKEQL